MVNGLLDLSQYTVWRSVLLQPPLLQDSVKELY